MANKEKKFWRDERPYTSYRRILLNDEILEIENSYGNHTWWEDDSKVHIMVDCKMEKNLSMCEQELIDLTDIQFNKHLHDFLSTDKQYNKYLLDLLPTEKQFNIYFSDISYLEAFQFTEEKDQNKMTTLLHFLNLFSVSGQEKKKKDVKQYLTNLLAQMSEKDLYSIYNEYLDQLLTSKSTVTEEDLCIREIDPYYELQLILCYGEKLIKQEKYFQYQELIYQNVNFFISMIQRMKTRKDYKTMSKTCKFLAHVIDIGTSCQLPGLLWNHEDFAFLLPELLSMLQKVNSKMRDPFFELLYQLFLCKKQINENEGDADLNIIARCLNNFIRKKFRENQTEVIALIISTTDILSENSFLKKLLQRFLRQSLKTVNSTPSKSLLHKKELKWNEIFNDHDYRDAKSKKDLIYAQCACIVSGKRMRNVDTNQYLRKLNIKGPEDENEAETQSEQEKLLMLFIILLLVTTLGHKSTKLKKYLALKYEYHMASLYLLWCSGDIEVHPGPPKRKKQLKHNSERKRKWLQEINTILLKLYWGIPTQSKPKNLWDRKPKEWPPDVPFYDTKNASTDFNGNKATNDEILTHLLVCLQKTDVAVPKTYQSEISAWGNKNIILLHTLQVLRIEMENIKSATLNLFLYNCEDIVKNLQGIKISLEISTLDKMETQDLLTNGLRQKDHAEIVSKITRELANTLCRLARGIDPTEKGDGMWNLPPPAEWPEDVPFFNPNNRGKNKPKCSDKVLVCTFLELKNLRIPQNLKQIVDAYKDMYNSTNTEEKEINNTKLCRLGTMQSNVLKLDYAMQYLYKEGLFSMEVYNILSQWRETQSIDKQAEHVLKSCKARSDERPHITIDITKTFETDPNRDNISYTIPINNGYLHIKCTTVAPNEPSKDNTIRTVLTTAINQENKEDSVKHLNSIQFLSDDDFGNQTEFPDDKLVSWIDKDNGPETSDLERQESISSATYAYQETQIMLDTKTTHNNQSFDIDSSRSYTKSQQTCASDYSIVENLASENTRTSKVKKRIHSEDNEEIAKKLLKTKGNQNGGETLEPNDTSTRNNWIICNNNELDSWSLDLSLVDTSSAHSLGAMCECKNSKDIQSCKQICNLESLVCQNQYLPENIDGVKNNDNQNDQIDEEELENCLDLVNYVSGKPSEIEAFLTKL